MISITTDTITSYQPLVINELPTSDLRSKEARLSRAMTLDGGVYINNSGFVDGDRTLIISANLSEDQVSKLNYISENFISINLSMSDGVYSAAIKSIRKSGINYKITIYIKEKVS